MQIEEYRIRLERFYETVQREVYNHWSGRCDRLDLAAAYSDFSDLFSSETIFDFQPASESTPESFPSRRRSLRKLHAFALEQRLDHAAYAPSQEIASLEANRRFSWDGIDIEYVQVPLHLSRESDYGKRRRLNDFRLKVLNESRSLREARLRMLQAEANNAGFKDYLAAMNFVTGINYNALSRELERVLEATESLFLDRLRETVQSACGLRVVDILRCDLAYWIRSCEPVGVFASKHLLPALERTISDLGLTPERKDAILMDLDARPLKRARASCIPIRIPFEIAMVLMPGGGFDRFAALLHEAGHAHHFAWTSADLPAEHRLCGDRGLSETYAFLFESVARDTRWLRDKLSIARPEGFLQAQALYRAYQVRNQIGRLRCEVSLYSEGGLSSAPDVFGETMEKCTGVPHERECWLEDTQDPLESADYLRAWIAAGMLEGHLRSRFGNDWFMNRRAGSFLKELWETGQLYGTDELCREIGIGALDVQVLVDGMREGLKL